MQSKEAHEGRARGCSCCAAAAAAQAAAAARPPQSSQQPLPPVVDVAGQLAKLAELKEQGILDDSMFEAAVAKVLAASPAPQPPQSQSQSPPQPPSPPRTQSPPPPPTVAVPPATGSIDLLAVANKSDSSEPLSDDDDDDEPAPPAPPAPAPPPPALPPKAPPPTAPPPTVPPPAALPQAAPPSGGLSEAQRMRMEANRQAAVARQKQKAPPPPAPLPPAPPPPAAPTPTAPRLPALPSAAAGIVEISDALGVSSAPNLGMRDLLTLRQTIDESSSAEHLACVLRRLEMTLSPMTPELSRTGIVEAVASLTEHEDACVRDSSARITHSWSTQLAAERRRRELASRPGPKPKGTGALGCRACQGAHRAHTCE